MKEAILKLKYESGNIEPTATELTRALLGLVRPLLGGGGRSGPPSISETNRRGEKIQMAMERPGRDL